MTAPRQLQIIGKDWDSGPLPVDRRPDDRRAAQGNGRARIRGAVFWTKKAKPLPQHDQTLTITRLVASTGNIPASQTIAVKALDHAYAQENILLPIVKKGDTFAGRRPGEIQKRAQS